MPPKKKPKKKARVAMKQKQRQSQKVIINLAPPKRRRVATRVKPRPMSFQQDTSRVLAQFAQPVPMIPDRLIYPVSLPQPIGTPTTFTPARAKPSLVDEFIRARPPPVIRSVGGRSEREKEFDREVSSGLRADAAALRMPVMAGKPQRNAMLDATKEEARELPLPLNRRFSSERTTAPNTPFTETDFTPQDGPTQDPFDY